MRKKNRKSLHSKRGFTLVELVVVIAILSICSGMLVGVVSGSMDRYSVSTDIENSKQEATSFERMYKKYVSGAYSISASEYNESSFLAQNNHYYLILNPTDKTAKFLMAYEDDTTKAVELTDVITCKGVGSFSQKVNNVGKDDSQKYVEYKICMISNYEPDTTYDYSGTVTFNNSECAVNFSKSNASEFNYNSNDINAKTICIDFSMTK